MTTMDARVRVYYKLTLWAWRLRWAKNPRANTANNADLPILISACLNLQMLKSPNFVYSTYQGIILVGE